ncbi:hypothetical protein PT974_09901 [Cladobotryum mycophilum]|uniref:Uncharacterized protein n=1 Tax=Cladobotryum mycophilum TaxID=491253 RepID=A0ABR0SHL4_9HYPO
MINTRKMRYTGEAITAMKANGIGHRLENHDSFAAGALPRTAFGNRLWIARENEPHPAEPPTSGRKIGEYPLTSTLAPWVSHVFANFQPDDQVQDLVKPFTIELHQVFEAERAKSSGLHNLTLIEVTYQIALEVSAAILLAADATGDPVCVQNEFHSSHAANDDHFRSWGKLLTGLDCDPPIIVMFPFYLMMCQSFSFESSSQQADYVYSALTGIDWVQGKGSFGDRMAAFEKLAWSSVPSLDDIRSGQDRSFWRVALSYLRALNHCENSRSFKAPRKARIAHSLDHDLVIAARAMDTMGSAYMCSDGAAWFDNAGVDALLGSGLPNDVMDLHADIRTGETRNLLRLLYDDGLTMEQSMQTVSTLLSGQLCELFRGHYRARFSSREDGRLAATSPAYSFCRARHRKVFATLEIYIARYPKFWDWTWEIYRLAKEQVTEAGVSEPLVSALKRSVGRNQLPPSAPTKFYNMYYEMIENGAPHMQAKRPLGVGEDLAPVVRQLYSLWHGKLTADKQRGWGHEFDAQSDMLLSQAGEILAKRGGISEDMYEFAIAYGKLSMSLPYIAYHTIDAIIMTFGTSE